MEHFTRQMSSIEQYFENNCEEIDGGKSSCVFFLVLRERNRLEITLKSPTCFTCLFFPEYGFHCFLQDRVISISLSDASYALFEKSISFRSRNVLPSLFSRRIRS